MKPQKISDEHKRVFIQTKESRHCRQLFYLYTGNALVLMMDPLAFLAKTKLIQRNLAMFRDLSRNLFMGHISDQIPDLNAFIDWQRAYRERCRHVDEFYTVGSSAGGYSAMLFGHCLEADEVWALAPPSELSRDELPETTASIPAEYFDMAQLLSNWNGKTRYNIYYCENFEQDRIAAERLANCPGVTLHPLPGETHIVANILDEQGKLGDLLPPLRTV